ncbi:2-hydroxyisoflavanone dehydratase-like [Vigna angularis]|nr:2-hydroxyisoflavanone dehydratase-like [Vigna angularis]
MRVGTEPLPCDVKILGAIFSHPYFYSSEPIGSEAVTGHKQRLFCLVWDFVYPSAPGGIDNPMVNPFAPGAPSLDGLGCSKIIVCVASEDKIRDRGVWYLEGVRKSGWQGKLELFEEQVMRTESVIFPSKPLVEEASMENPPMAIFCWLCFSFLNTENRYIVVRCKNYKNLTIKCRIE